MLRLTDYIAAAGGWLPMDKMMELALYHPSEGYYSASIQNIGPRGDFSTTATLSPILAKAIVAKWKEACKEFGQKLPFLEIGAGNASLAMAIAEELGFWKRLTVDTLSLKVPPISATSSTRLSGALPRSILTSKGRSKHATARRLSSQTNSSMPSQRAYLSSQLKVGRK